MIPQHGAWSVLDRQVMHDLMRLRVDVFVVEQQCPYPELDGRDVDPATDHVWIADGDGPAAYLRVLSDPPDADGEVHRIGRVCTRADARGRGLAAVLMDDVVARHGHEMLVLEAQAHLAAWYARFGFARSGADYVEDGIPHTPMRRTAAAGAGYASAATSSPSGTRGPV